MERFPGVFTEPVEPPLPPVRARAPVPRGGRMEVHEASAPSRVPGEREWPSHVPSAPSLAFGELEDDKTPPPSPPLGHPVDSSDEADCCERPSPPPGVPDGEASYSAEPDSVADTLPAGMRAHYRPERPSPPPGVPDGEASYSAGPDSVADALPAGMRAHHRPVHGRMTPPVAAGSAEPHVPPGKRSAEEMEGSPEPRFGSPPSHRSREQSGSCDPSPVFRICPHLVGLSRVNNECTLCARNLGRGSGTLGPPGPA